MREIFGFSIARTLSYGVGIELLFYYRIFQLDSLVEKGELLSGSRGQFYATTGCY